MKILFFSPFSSIDVHVEPELELIRGLKKDNAIYWINCNGYMNQFCIAMSATGLTELSPDDEKMKVCNDCKHKRNLYASENALSSDLLDTYIEKDEENAINGLLLNITGENYYQFTYRDIPIGAIASYEFLINHKKCSYSLSQEELSAYKIALRNSLLTYFSIRKVLDKYKPDIVVMHNSLYSVNNITRVVAESLHIPAYSFVSGLNAAYNYQSLIVTYKSNAFFWDYVKTAVWEKNKNSILSKQQIRYVHDHISALFNSKTVWVYSTKREHRGSQIRDSFGIKKNQQLLIATMSSYDERFAINTIGEFLVNDSLFSSQYHWISSVIDWVREKDDLFLLIRVHPREFPNRRESVLSEHAQQLKNKFIDLPKNVKVNWPDDNISIYDLAEEASCFLNAWSSVGVEMSALGIPVVLYNRDYPLYPASLNYIGDKSIENYFSTIEQALSDGWSFERVVRTYRWLATILGSTIIKRHSRVNLINQICRISFFRKAIKKVFKYEPIEKHYFKKNDINIVKEIFNGNGKVVSDLRFTDATNSDYEKKAIQRSLRSLLEFSKNKERSKLQIAFEDYMNSNEGDK